MLFRAAGIGFKANHAQLHMLLHSEKMRTAHGLFLTAVCVLVLCLHIYLWTTQRMAREKASVLFQDILRHRQQKKQQPQQIHSNPKQEALKLSACNNAVWTGSRAAFVTMLTQQADPAQWYRLSAQKLGTMLQMWLPEVDRVALIVDGNEAHSSSSAAFDFRLKRSGWKVCHVPAIDGPKTEKAQIYSKFNAWRLVEYEAVCFMDADVMVLGDPAELFEVHFPQMQRLGMQLAAPRDRPVHTQCLLGGYNMPNNSFNAGILLFKPEARVADLLIQSIDTVPHSHAEWAEQALLNALYPAFYELPFDVGANLVSKLCEPDVWRTMRPTIVHMTIAKGWSPPWTCWEWDVQQYCALWDLIPPSSYYNQ